ncbi:MAG TPA: hypothetical protein VMT09_04790 [Steroidobacteraceae bacterium]|nr:hypothetical protein [Steroidobacteraceae bacterium]
MPVDATLRRGFRNEACAQLHSAPTHAARRFLVFVRCGSTPVPQPRWNLAGAVRSYDILANFFAPPAEGCWLLESADYVASGGWSKFCAAKQLLGAELLERYSGVLLLDDDVETHFDPGVFAEWVSAQGIDLAQPSLTADSVGGHRVCRHHPSCAWRETNFVEVMAPYFSQALLRTAIGDFDRSISTWGLDVLWGANYGRSHRLAIIDLFTMAHRRPSDIASGAFYQYLRRLGVDPLYELAAILQALGLERFDIETRRVTFLADGIRLPETR